MKKMLKNKLFQIFLLPLLPLFFTACQNGIQLQEDVTEYLELSGHCYIEANAEFSDLNSADANASTKTARTISFDSEQESSNTQISYVIQVFDLTLPAINNPVFETQAYKDGGFKLKLPVGKTYTIQAFGYDGRISSEQNDTTLILNSAPAVLEVENGKKIENFDFKLKPIMDEGSFGSAEFLIQIAYNSVIKSALVKYSNDSYSDNVLVTFNQETTVPVSITDIPTGTYNMDFEFYASSDGTGNKVFAIYGETMNIYKNLKSNTWINESFYAGNNMIYISNEVIESYNVDDFYVSSDATNLSNTGTYFDPFPTLSKAVQFISSMGSGSNQKKIHLLTDINEDEVTISAGVPIEITNYNGNKPVVKANFNVNSGTLVLNNLTLKNTNSKSAVTVSSLGSLTTIRCTLDADNIARPLIDASSVDIIPKTLVLNETTVTGYEAPGIDAYNTITQITNSSFSDCVNALNMKGGISTLQSVHFENNKNNGIDSYGANILISDNHNMSIMNTMEFKTSYNTDLYTNDVALCFTKAGSTPSITISAPKGLSSANRMKISLVNGEGVFTNGDVILKNTGNEIDFSEILAYIDVVYPVSTWALSVNENGNAGLSKLVNYYVSSGAGSSDLNDGATRDSPFATVQKAVDTIIAVNAAAKVSDPADTTEYGIILLSDIKASDSAAFTASKNSSDVAIGNSYIDITPASGTQLKLNITAEKFGTVIDVGRKADSSTAGRVMYVSSDVILKMDGIVLSGGYQTDQNGGGLYIDAGAEVHLTDCTIRNNRANYGGGIYLNGGTLTLTDCTVGINRIYYSGAEATASDCSNYAANSGGGIYIDSSVQQSSFTSTDSDFVYNYAEKTGGGLSVGTATSHTHKKFLITGGNIAYNGAKTNGGGLNIYALKGCNPELINVSVEFNYSGSNGGGIQVPGSHHLFITSCIIRGNRCVGSGGGIYAAGAIQLTEDQTGIDISLNTAGAESRNSNFHYMNATVVTVNGDIGNSCIYVTNGKGTYPFALTSGYGYGTTNTKNPSEIFKCDEPDLEVGLNGTTEAYLVYNGSAEGNIDINGPEDFTVALNKSTVSSTSATTLSIIATAKDLTDITDSLTIQNIQFTSVTGEAIPSAYSTYFAANKAAKTISVKGGIVSGTRFNVYISGTCKGYEFSTTLTVTVGD